MGPHYGDSLSGGQVETILEEVKSGSSAGTRVEAGRNDRQIPAVRVGVDLGPVVPVGALVRDSGLSTVPGGRGTSNLKKKLFC